MCVCVCAPQVALDRWLQIGLGARRDPLEREREREVCSAQVGSGEFEWALTNGYIMEILGDWCELERSLSGASGRRAELG